MKKLLILALALFSFKAYALPRTVPYVLEDQDTTDGYWESQPLRLASAHRYFFQVKTAAGVTIAVYISGDCKEYQILSGVSAVSTVEDDLISINNANYPCAKLRVNTTNPVTALGLVKEGV